MTEDPWGSLGEWWLEELDDDPAYREEIEPLLLSLLEPVQGGLYLDAGCGEGRVMTAIRQRGAVAVGCDLNRHLLAIACRNGPVFRVNLPALDCVRPGTLDGVAVGLVLEHIRNEQRFFSDVAAAVRSGGSLAVVINHPVWTAPGSSPMEDVTGEMLWRPGEYFGRGHSDEPAGTDTVRFYHRTMADLLNAASESGWDLQRLEEGGVTAGQIQRYPDYAGQEHIPRLLGARWRRR